MPSPTQVLPQTSIAAVTWVDANNLTQIRVFAQYVSGDIHESVYDGTSWSFNEEPVNRLGNGIDKVKLGSPIAASNLNDLTNVYYLTEDNFIHQVYRGSQRPGWFSGPLNDAKVQASPSSRLAALDASPGTGVDQHVFFQDTDGAIRKVKRVGRGWIQEPKRVADSALKGTGLSALTFKDTDDGVECTGIRVFYQLPGGLLEEAWALKDKDYQRAAINLLNGNPLADASTNSDLSVYSNSPGSSAHRLFFINSSNSVSEIGYYGNVWHVEHSGQTLARRGSGLTALPKALPNDPSSKLRYFIQDETDKIVVWCNDDGSEQYFHKEAVVPTAPQ